MPEQDEVVAFLKRPEVFDRADRVEVIETHGAYVFLAGSDALKVKRAVRYDYLDYTTLDRRSAALRRELDLNAPAAPSIYRDVVPVTREADGRLALNGAGTPVEWVLRMNRFPAEAQLDRMADRGALTREIAEALGTSVARYHAAAPVAGGADGARRIADILDELRREFGGMADALPAAEVSDLMEQAERALARVGTLLDRRAQGGHVRRCHGDLHLSNIVLIDGAPVPFDALEFSEELGTCDVLYDLAFLLMDLRHRGLDTAANAVLNRYLHEAGAEDHYAGLAALPLFLAVRCLIRAMVSVQVARARGADWRHLGEAQRYLHEAGAALTPAPARLIAVGGLSGTGKTTLARALAPLLGAAPGAVHLRSDMIRKALSGVDPLTPLPQDGYSAAMSARVYARMGALCRQTLGAGQAAVVDAVFLEEGAREEIARLAETCGVPFDGIWLEAAPEVMLARVRERGPDASDADAEVVQAQVDRKAGSVGWLRIAAGGKPDETLRCCREALGLGGEDAQG